MGDIRFLKELHRQMSTFLSDSLYINEAQQIATDYLLFKHVDQYVPGVEKIDISSIPLYYVL